MSPSDLTLAPSGQLAADSLASLKDRVADTVRGRRAELLGLSHAIHANPELSWEEFAAAELVAGVLDASGFAVEREAYGLPTAIKAVAGSGDLTVAICAEYDALPGIGHGCGHNVIATAGVGAAIALAGVAREAGLRVKLLGTPAEEHGGGKVVAGAWEDVDFSLMVHGMTGTDTSAAQIRTTAVERFEVEFHGRTAHAAASPELGINAASAAAIAQTSIAYLRQQLPAEANLNAFVSLGGEATNIIPDRTVVQVELRAYDLDIWRDMKARVLACFEGAAIATGCTWEWRPTEHPYAPLVMDPDLCELWDDNARALGREPGDAPSGGPAARPTWETCPRSCPRFTR